MMVLSAEDVLPDFDSLSRDALIGLCRAQYQEVQELRALVHALTEGMAQLESRGNAPPPPSDLSDVQAGAPPPFVKANRTKPKEKTVRQGRTTPHFRPLDKPTAFAEHVCASCPDCGRKLSGGWVHRTRQVIEVVPAPVQITEHRFIARYCGVCQKRVLPSVNLSKQVVGKHRVGIGLMSSVKTCFDLGWRPPYSGPCAASHRTTAPKDAV